MTNDTNNTAGNDYQQRLVLTVDRDGWTKGLQLSIGDESGGFRIKGPKYNGSSNRLLTAGLSKLDAREIRRYLDKYFPSENYKLNHE